MTLRNYFQLLLFAFLLQTLPLISKEILIYGENGCEFCKSFKQNLEDSDIKFTYFEISGNKTNEDKMRKLVKSAYPNLGSIQLPVVLYDSKVFLRPNFSDFLMRLKFPPRFKSFSEKNKIILYTELESPSTARLIENLRARQMKYETKNISVREVEEEMKEKLTKKNIEYNYQLPIVAIGNHIIQGASFKDLSKVIR